MCLWARRPGEVGIGFWHPLTDGCGLFDPLDSRAVKTSFLTSMFPRPLIGWRRVALILALLALAGAQGRAEAQSCGRSWLQNYSTHPSPDQFVPAVFELSRTDYFAMPNRVLIGLGFFSSLFRQNPDYVDEWLYYSRMLPERERRMIISALWMAGHPKGEEFLRLYMDRVVRPESAAKLEKVLAPKEAAENPRRAKGLSSLYVQWGEFLATGDEEILRDIMTALTNDSRMTVRDRWWLACTAAQHQRVIIWCEEHAADAPPDLKDAIRLVVQAKRPEAMGG